MNKKKSEENQEPSVKERIAKVGEIMDEFHKQGVPEEVLLLQKLSAIQAAIGKIKPDGKNNKQGWEFISNNRMNQAMSELLPQHKVFIVKNLLELKNLGEVGSSSSNTKVFKAEAKMRFDIYDLETGYCIQVPFSGWDKDSGGKEGAQAITEAVKRFYFKQFDVAEGLEDPDTKTNPVRADSAPTTKAPPQNPQDTFSQMPEAVQKATLEVKLPTDQAIQLYRALKYSEKKLLAVMETYKFLLDSKVGTITVKAVVDSWKAVDWNDSEGKVLNWAQGLAQEALQGQAGEDNQAAGKENVGEEPQEAQT